MKLPRNLSADDLIKAFSRLGYQLTRGTISAMMESIFVAS
jgi:hypothetical protein